MKHIQTAIDIEAPPEIVWEVLTDLDVYHEWNPYITEASGEISEGETVTIRVEPTGRRDSTLRCTVTEVVPERRLQWVGRLRVPGLFTGRHTFELEPLGNDRTRFVNHEDVFGLLARFVVTEETPLDYDWMNQELARRAELQFNPQRTAEA
ncbi:SRPBCC domain-containing protein [Haloprofundus salinisoli]|uniref:SRPBCC domain-containing protein n=1 Tax=Haloprofundus salinisoli TaxID=2876193 RepID=UPI001CCFB634|nr:SRPBCC domain-containing protein [Haloprofundus salinisoli]